MVKLPSRDLTANVTGGLVYGVALSLASLALPLLMLEAGYSGVEVGVLTAMSAITQLVSRVYIGRIMRVVPDWVLVAGAAALLAASSAIAAASTALVPLVIAQLLQGSSRAFFWTGSQTHVVRGSLPAVKALAATNFVANFGLLLGPVLGGIIAERSAAHAMAVCAAVAALAAVPAFFLDRLPPFVKQENRPHGRLWQRPGVHVGCWAGVTAGAWRGMLGSYIPVALVTAGHSASAVGVLVATANAASILGALLVGGLAGRGLFHAFWLGTVGTGLAVGLTGVTASSVLLCSLALMVSGIAAGALQTIGPAIATEAVHPEERGEAIAATGTFRAASLFVLPLGAAGVVAVAPVAVALGLVGLVITLPVVYASSLDRHLREEPAVV